MRNSQPRFAVSLTQLRRVELYTKQTVEELKLLSKHANDEAACEIADMLDLALALRNRVVDCARVWRPVEWTSLMQQRAEVRRRIARRKERT